MATIESKGANKWLIKVSDGFNIDGTRRRFTKAYEGTPKQVQAAAILFLYIVYTKHGILSSKKILK